MVVTLLKIKRNTKVGLFRNETHISYSAFVGKHGQKDKDVEVTYLDVPDKTTHVCHPDNPDWKILICRNYPYQE